MIHGDGTPRPWDYLWSPRYSLGKWLATHLVVEPTQIPHRLSLENFHTQAHR